MIVDSTVKRKLTVNYDSSKGSVKVGGTTRSSGWSAWIDYGTVVQLQAVLMVQ